MNRCLITYELIPEEACYSRNGLRRLSPRLETLRQFPYSVSEQLQESARQARYMSIQGVQPKLSVILDVRKNCFTVVDTGGRYIVKPQNPLYPELSENEDVTMHLAEMAGIDVSLHGLLLCADGSRSYFIRRFDRTAKGRLAVEDFAQLAGENRDTKYNSSVEKVCRLLEFCTFPSVERARLYRRILFNFLVGNEDMHLKNYSLITRDRKTELAPAYDFLNTCAVFLRIGRNPDDIEESALPLNGRRRKLLKSDFTEYLAYERLQLETAVVKRILNDLLGVQKEWMRLLDECFLSNGLKTIYRDVIARRCQRLFS